MLKERQQRILDYTKQVVSTKGYPPTVREICEALDIKSTSTVHSDLETLVQLGYLVKDPSKPRALMVMDPGSNSGHLKAAGNYDGLTKVAQVVDIPVVGRVAAGQPILAEENIEDQ